MLPNVSIRHTILFLVLSILLLATSGTLLADGTQTGVVTGTVVDESGTVVEGALVTLSGDRGERTQETNTDGRFRFQSLDIGAYRATAELPGLAGASANGAVTVSIGRISDIRLELGSDSAASNDTTSLEETIQVFAEAPMVDRYSTRVGGNIRFDFIDELPVERFYQTAALLLPGVSGGADGNPNVNGSLRSNNLYLIDGVDTTDPTTGLFGLNLHYEAVKEVEVTTGSISPEYGRLSGAVINVVTRSGTDDLEGTARWIATDQDANSEYNPVDNARRTLGREIEVANSGSDGTDGYASLSLGGPLVKKKLWFYAGYENPESSFRRPVFEGAEFWNLDQKGENQAYKLSWQVNNKVSVVGQFTADELDRNDFQPFNDVPGETDLQGTGAQGTESATSFSFSFVQPFPGDQNAVETHRQSGDFGKIQINSILGKNSNLFFSVASQERELKRINDNARNFSAGSPHLDLDRSYVFNGITVQGQETRPREQANLTFDWFFTSSHTDQELTTGLSYQSTDSMTSFRFPGRTGIDQLTGLPFEGQLFLDFDFRQACLDSSPIFDDCAGFEANSNGTFLYQPFVLWNFLTRPDRKTSQETTAFFVSDEVVFKRWYINFGFRFEDIQGEDQGGLQIVDAQTVSPRVGFTYDLTNKGKTLVRGSYGRFYEPFLQKYADFFSRNGLFTGLSEYFWFPTLLEIFDLPPTTACANEDPSNPNSFCWLADETFSLQPTQIAPPNTELDPTYVDEFTIGFEHQFSNKLALSLTYIDREWGDIWDDVFSIIPLLNEDGSVQRNDLGQFLFSDFTSTIANLDDARREYQAVQVLLQKRMSNNWQFLGSYTWSETKGNIFENDSFDEFADFSDLVNINDPAFTALVNEDLANRFGLAPYDREHQFKIFANYRIPLERLDFSIGTSLRYESGLPFQRQVNGNLTSTRFVTPRGSERLDDIFQLDLSFATDIKLKGDFAFEIKADIFNVTDEQELVGVETFDNESSSSLFGQARNIFDIQPPRSYRLTLGFRF